jgi:hypothetical protein
MLRPVQRHDNCRYVLRVRHRNACTGPSCVLPVGAIATTTRTHCHSMFFVHIAGREWE